MIDLIAVAGQTVCLSWFMGTSCGRLAREGLVVSGKAWRLFLGVSVARLNNITNEWRGEGAS